MFEPLFLLRVFGEVKGTTRGIEMKRHVLIRFRGDHKTGHWVTLGPFRTVSPDERRFRGGEEVWVNLSDTPNRPGSVDLEFEDGEIALEYPAENFTILQ